MTRKRKVRERVQANKRRRAQPNYSKAMRDSWFWLQAKLREIHERREADYRAYWDEYHRQAAQREV